MMLKTITTALLGLILATSAIAQDFDVRMMDLPHRLFHRTVRGFADATIDTVAFGWPASWIGIYTWDDPVSVKWRIWRNTNFDSDTLYLPANQWFFFTVLADKISFQDSDRSSSDGTTNVTLVAAPWRKR